MTNRTILVTGGSGFIGTHLCSALAGQANEVRILDVNPPNPSLRGVSFCAGDVRDKEVVSTAVRDVDAVFHLAAIVSVPLCDQSPVESYETNLNGTVNLLECLSKEVVRTGKKVRVVFSSSSAVYGNLGQKEVGLHEDQSLGVPLSLYAAQKLGSEHFIRIFSSQHGILPTVLRFFNVFGPGQRHDSPYSGVISRFARSLLERKALDIHGGGNQTRDFVFVDDVVRACILATAVTENRCHGEPINIGCGAATSIRHLAEVMMNVFEEQVPLTQRERRPGDVMHSCASVTAASDVLGWRPTTTLIDGLQLLREHGSQK